MNTLQEIDTLTPFEEDLYPYFKNGFNHVYNVGTCQYMKIYNDGGHFIGRLITHSDNSGVRNSKTEFEIMFDRFFQIGLQNNLRKTNLHNYIKDCFLDNFGDIFENLDRKIDKLIERKFANIHKRLTLFRRKARLNKWNYFVTLTYDDKKQTAESFKSKLKKCLANFHCRRNWKYMGVFEYSPENHRLHFHALMYIPKGEMVGTIIEKQDYSTAQHKMQTAHINTFFNDVFGRNDFAEITDCDIKFGNAIDYVTKYIAKSGEKILYSRGIPSELLLKINYKDVAVAMFDFIQKFVLFDDVITYKEDNLIYNRRL